MLLRRLPRRPSHALLALATAAMVAALALVFPLGVTASAAGPLVTYTLKNDTDSTLWLKTARIGTGKKCTIDEVTGAVDCPQTGPQDFPGSAPLNIPPGSSGTVRLQIDSSKVPEMFQVIYLLPVHGTVYIYEHGSGYGCRVIGTKDFVCRLTGGGAERTWVVRPA